MNFLSNSKKSNVIMDVIMWVVLAFVLIIALVFGKMIFTDINDDLQVDDSLNAENKQIIDTLHTNYSGFFDKVFLFVLILMVVLILVASFMVDSHPIFFIASLILFFIVIFLGAMLSNTIEEIGNDSEISTAYNSFPIIKFVNENFIAFIVGVGFMVMVALYTKNRFG